MALVMQRGLLEFLVETAGRYGDVAHFRAGRNKYYLLSHPEHIRDVLVTHDANFTKGPALRNAKVTLGEGLLTSEDPLHRRQRRLVQPAFQPHRVAGYADTMVRYAERLADRWRDGQSIDSSDEMTRLTLGIVAKALFDAEIDEEVRQIGEAMAVTVTMFDRARTPLAPLLNRLPLPSNFRFRRSLKRVVETVERMIEQRRAGGEDRGDFLSILLNARDAEGGGMSDQQVRDEAITLFSAGHETTANALVWTWYLLAQHPQVERRLHGELDSTLPDRPPTADDVPKLTYTRAVVSESMRLYPPAWIVGRQARADYRAGDYMVPAGGVVLMSQYVVHRDARWWPDPLLFKPERWADKSAMDRRPRYAYFPFGGGQRSCIGEPFAWAEAVLLIATLARRWRLRLTPGQKVELLPTITLRPKRGIRMQLERRAGVNRLSLAGTEAV
jgi:cytochrome P450